MAKRGRGRPTDYRPEYCEAVVDHCQDGASLTSFAASVGVARSTINEWMAANPDFSEAATRAKAAAAAWWENTARKVASEGGGNATLCVFGLKNMGAEDWSDKSQVELSGPNGGPMSHTVTLTNAPDAVLEFLAGQSLPDEG